MGGCKGRGRGERSDSIKGKGREEVKGREDTRDIRGGRAGGRGGDKAGEGSGDMQMRSGQIERRKQ